MGYDISLSSHGDYLRIVASGRRSRPDSEELARYMARVSSEHGIFKILLVLELTGRLSTFELHDLVTEFRDCGLDARHRIAFIDENDESKPDQDFVEDVVRTRGLDAMAFDTESAAVDWLLSPA